MCLYFERTLPSTEIDSGWRAAVWQDFSVFCTCWLKNEKQKLLRFSWTFRVCKHAGVCFLRILNHKKTSIWSVSVKYAEITGSKWKKKTPNITVAKRGGEDDISTDEESRIESNKFGYCLLYCGSFVTAVSLRWLSNVVWSCGWYDL